MAKGSISDADFVIFNQQLASLTKTGLPLSQSLESLSRDVRSRRFREGIERVRAEVEAGVSLSQAVGKHPHVFPEIYSRIIAAGEDSDNLPDVLSQLAKYSETMARMRRKVKDALAYPLTVFVAALAILCFLTLFALPRLLGSLELLLQQQAGGGFEVELRGVSAFFLGVARALANNNIEIAVVIGCLVFGILLLASLLHSFRGGRVFLDRLKLALPLYGRCLMNGYTLRFSQTLGTLLKSHVPIGDAIYLTSESVGSESMKPAFHRLREQVEAGTKLSESLKKSGIFPEAATWILSAGDEKGQLDQALMEVSEVYEAELERGVGRMAFWVEILATMVIGLFVVFIVLTVFVPIMQLIRSIQGPSE